LRGALRREAERRTTHGLAVAVEIGDPPAGLTDSDVLSPREEEGLLRIAQEALNNVAKHSGTTTATVRVRLRGAPRMEIADAGRGLERSAIGKGPGLGKGPGFGLETMGQRAAEIGWRLEVVSSAGTGVRVVVERSSSGEGKE
jgi:signal transduction histidine kinase